MFEWYRKSKPMPEEREAGTAGDMAGASLFSEKINELFDAMSPKEKAFATKGALMTHDPDLYKAIMLLGQRDVARVPDLAERWAQNNRAKVVLSFIERG